MGIIYCYPAGFFLLCHNTSYKCNYGRVKQVSDFQPLLRKQWILNPLVLPQAQGLPSVWGGCSAFLRWDRWAANEGPEWFFALKKPHLMLSWAPAWMHGAGVYDQSQRKRIFWLPAIPDVARMDSRIQKWSKYIPLPPTPRSVAALVDKDCACMRSFAPSNTSLVILCSSCRMFWANQSAPDVIVIGQNDTWKRKEINLILKRIPFSWVICLWRQSDSSWRWHSKLPCHEFMEGCCFPDRPPTVPCPFLLPPPPPEIPKIVLNTNAV